MLNIFICINVTTNNFFKIFLQFLYNSRQMKALGVSFSFEHFVLYDIKVTIQFSVPTK